MSWKKTFVYLVTAVHLTEIEFCPGGKESPRKPPKSCRRTQLAFCTFFDIHSWGEEGLEIPLGIIF